MTTIRMALKEGGGRRKQIEPNKVLAAQTIIFDSEKCTTQNTNTNKCTNSGHPFLSCPFHPFFFISVHHALGGGGVARVVQAGGYKLEGWGLDSGGCS